jgi:nucleoside-diphosphate-sugar epimerase
LLDLPGDHSYRLALRPGKAGGAGHETVTYALDDTGADYARLLDGIDVVIHLAGLAHARVPAGADYNNINARGTARLIAESVRRKIKRFIFLSSIKVHGESTGHGLSITETTAMSPQDGYSSSKLAAEEAIITACEGSHTEFVILRPPLVYGPGVKANFLDLLRLVSWRIPLPLAGVNNRRSLVYVDNLCHLIHICIDHPAAANQVFVIKDHDDSTPGLITRISRAFGREPWLFPLPTSLLVPIGYLLGQGGSMLRLTESLLIDDGKLRRVLGWQSPVDADAGIRATVSWYTRTRQAGAALPRALP